MSKIKPSKINRILLDYNVKVTPVDKPMGRLMFEMFLKNNDFSEEKIKEIIKGL